MILLILSCCLIIEVLVWLILDLLGVGISNLDIWRILIRSILIMSIAIVSTMILLFRGNKGNEPLKLPRLVSSQILLRTRGSISQGSTMDQIVRFLMGCLTTLLLIFLISTLSHQSGKVHAYIVWYLEWRCDRKLSHLLERFNGWVSIFVGQNWQVPYHNVQRRLGFCCSFLGYWNEPWKVESFAHRYLV